MRSAKALAERGVREMKGWLLLGAIAASLVMTVTVLGAQSPASPNAANGRRLFEKDGCYQCHGYAGQGGRDGARLAATAMNAQSFVRYVRGPFGAMPAFTAKVLPDEELADIYAFLKSLPTAAAAKDIPALARVREK
jgi:mono/diheme cytochrome c family protein